MKKKIYFLKNTLLTACFVFFSTFVLAQSNTEIDIPIEEVIIQLETGKTSVLNNKVNLRQVHFKTGTSKLLNSDKIYLDSLSAYLIRIPTIKLSIEGHTDATGNNQKNITLSKDRAEEVARYLVTKGVFKNQLSSKGWGSEKPLDNSNNPAAYEKNRRVELTFKNEEINAPEKEYKIELANGAMLNAKFVIFNADGSIGYKQTNLDTEPMKKLRPSEIKSVFSPDGGVLLESKRIADISQIVIKTEQAKVQKPKVQEKQVEEEELPEIKKEYKQFEIKENSIASCIGLGLNKQYAITNIGSYSNVPAVMFIAEKHIIFDERFGSISYGTLLGFRTSDYNYKISSDEYNLKTKNFVLGVIVSYHLPFFKTLVPQLDVYLGAMAGFSILKYNLHKNDDTFNVFTATYKPLRNFKGGFLGASYRLTKSFEVFGEAGFDITLLRGGLKYRY